MTIVSVADIVLLPMSVNYCKLQLTELPTPFILSVTVMTSYTTGLRNYNILESSGRQ